MISFLRRVIITSFLVLFVFIYLIGGRIDSFVNNLKRDKLHALCIEAEWLLSEIRDTGNGLKRFFYMISPQRQVDEEIDRINSIIEEAFGDKDLSKISIDEIFNALKKAERQ